MPETAFAPVVPVPVQGEATVPLASFIRPFQRHYFSRSPERPNYRARSYDFPGVPALMPLTRAFLDTCAATETDDYRYLFTLLGSELANNAIRHSLSGRGLAMIDALATDWGDNGNAEYRTVWLYLAYDLAESDWNTAALN